MLSHTQVPESPYEFAFLHNALNKTANTTQFTQLAYVCGVPGSDSAQKCKYYEKSPNALMGTYNQILAAKTT